MSRHVRALPSALQKLMPMTTKIFLRTDLKTYHGEAARLPYVAYKNIIHKETDSTDD